MFKKTLLVFMTFLVLYMGAIVSHAGTIKCTDIYDDWAESYIEEAVEKGYMSVTAAGRFRPNTKVDRYTLVAAIYKTVGNGDSIQPAEDMNLCVPEWIEPAAEYCLAKGYCDIAVMPKYPSKNKIAQIICSVLGDGVTENTLREEGIISEFNNDPVTRGQLATILVRAFDGEFEHTKKKLPSTVITQVPYYSQIDGIGAYVGCEPTSLYMCFKAKGYAQNITLKEFIDGLPRHESNPAKGFVGSPYKPDLTKKTRTTIFPKPLAQYASSYGNCEDFSGASVKEVRSELLNGNLLVAYMTMHWEKPFYRWYNVEGNTVRMLSNNHVIAVDGYDSSSNMYHISDPYNDKCSDQEYRYWIDGETFERIYNERRHGILVY